MVDNAALRQLYTRRCVAAFFGELLRHLAGLFYLRKSRLPAWVGLQGRGLACPFCGIVNPLFSMRG